MKTTKEKVAKVLTGARDYSWNPLHNVPLNTYGVWRICGESPSCDYGGSHYEPYLETVEGRLDKVLQHAVELPKFWTWGAGGSITPVTIKKV